MKKIFIAIAIVIFGIEAKELTVEQELKLLNYKRKLNPYSRLKYKRLMRYFAKIDRDKAIKRAKEALLEDIEHIKLTQRGRKLLYIIESPNHKLVIDALNGEIIEKRRLD